MINDTNIVCFGEAQRADCEKLASLLEKYKSSKCALDRSFYLKATRVHIVAARHRNRDNPALKQLFVDAEKELPKIALGLTDE